MREVTKSMLSYTWAMSVFSVQQAANLIGRGAGPGCTRAAEVFDGITGAMTGELDGRLKAVFRVGDNLQRQLVDAMSAGMGVLKPGQSTRSGATAGATPRSAPCGCAGSAATDAGMPPGWTFGRAPDTTAPPHDGQGRADERPSAERSHWRPMPPR